MLFGLHHHVNVIHSSDRTMEDHHLYDQKIAWMDYHPSFASNFFKYKNPKRSIDDPLSYALLSSNKEVLLVKNNQSTPLSGVKLSTNSSYHNALVTSSPHPLANGALTGIKLGLSLLPPTESNLWQLIAITQTTKTSEANASQMELSSVHFQQNTLPN